MLRFSRLLLASFAVVSSTAFAKEPGRGDTAKAEVSYLEFIIDHHFSALRMTELAAGTDATRDAELSKDEGTANTPGFEPVEARASLSEIRSMARQANREQREEILKAQRLLREWYGVDHTPMVMPDARADIEKLASTKGAEFDATFLRMFPRHHLSAAQQSLTCLAARDVRHGEIRRYCSAILMNQTNEIDEMRHLLCEQFDDCGFVPPNAKDSSAK